MSTSLVPRNQGVVVPTDPITLGNILTASGFFADSKQGAQAAVKVLAGQELGFGPVASMTGVYIVKGRVTLSANLMGAAIKRSAYDYRVTEHSAEQCVIDFYGPKLDGPGVEKIGTSAFSMQDAKDAGLANSDTYKKFPRNMLFSRALSNGAKWYCPDVFGGGPAYTPDELTDQVTYDADGIVTHVVEDAVEALPAPAVVVTSGVDVARLHAAASGVSWANLRKAFEACKLPTPADPQGAFLDVPADRVSGLVDALTEAKA